MHDLITINLFSWIAGITAFFGGVIAHLEGSEDTENKRELIHGIVAFGGGILVAAVPYSLVSEGIEVLSPAALGVSFVAGGLVFCWFDAYLSRTGGSRAQLMAMLMDFIPEAIALGALFSKEHKAAILLALFIGAQNLPEGFNSFRECRSNGKSVRSVLGCFLAVSLLGPAAATAGYLFLGNSPTVTAVIMSFAGGGILYLVFQDIAPQSVLRRHWSPPLGAVLGFLVGVLGKQLLG